jgi:tetratricopeptide (TPR) repeat protein
LPSADELTAAIEVGEPEATASHAIRPQPSVITPLDFDIDAEAVSAAEPGSAEPAVIDREPTPIEVEIEPSSYVPGPTLGVDYVSDLAGDLTAPLDADNSLFDFRAPPRSDGEVVEAPTPVNLDPDVAFPSFDLDDTSLPSADEVTSGASLTAALGTDETLGIGLDELDATVGEDSAAHSVERDAEPVLESSPASAAPAGDLDLEWPATAASEASASEASASALAASIDDMIVADTDDQPAHTPASSRDVISAVTPIDTASHVASDVEIEIPSDDLVDDVAVAPEAGAEADLTSSVIATGEMNVVAPTAETPPSTFAQKAPEREPEVSTTPATTPSVRPDETADRDGGWETQRAHAERLLEAGDRAGGVATLEQVAAELERLGDLERALTIVDELIRLSPDSIRHHQKRVELAFRSSDRVKLIDAYLELGDALFRSGEERKARAVYQRVHELAPDDPRARAAIESVASMSPPAGSGAIQAVPAPPADVRQPAAPTRPRDVQAPQAPASGNGAQRGSSITAPQSRKPSPLDRAAAANGEFVDLGEWLRSGENPKSTRMVAEEKPPTGDEQADFAEMLKRFKQGIAENVDEEDFESHYDLGVAYKEMGLMDEAVAEFQKALRGTTNRVRSYEALGQCFVEKEQFQVAASVLTRAIALGEGDDHHLVGGLYMLARATEALGRERDALDYYQRVFAVDIEFRDVADRIHAIERKAT